ncbi:MAG TPA: hypothetical protein VG710_00470, partial [Opitutus sp.]|nr:hypothetical protein [Opitutus sp.]
MRRFLIILASLAAALLALAATLPWWLGLALAWIGPAFGLHCGSYVREGYARFALENVTVRRRMTEVQIDRVAAETPVVWLWHRWTGNASVVEATSWRVNVAHREQASPERVRGWVPLHARLEHVADLLAFWLPQARVGRGIVTWPQGEMEFSSAHWRERTLTVPEIGYRKFRAAATLAVPAGQPMRLRAQSADGDLAVDLTTTGATVDGIASWAGQRAKVSARFPGEGWKPGEASLVAEKWNVPGARARVGAEYATLNGGGEIKWSDGRLTAKITAKGEPAKGAKAPPLSVDLDAQLDAAGIVVSAAEATGPGLSAHLTQPVRIDWHGRLQSQASAFAVSADLGKLPWFEGRGRLQGQGKVVPGRQQRVAVEFSASMDDVAIEGGAIAHAEANGRFEWPRLEIAAAKLAMVDWSDVSAAGGWDFRERKVLDAKIDGEVDRKLLAQWRPKLPQFDKVGIKAKASGPLRELTHEGQLETSSIKLGKLRPLAATISWRGRGAGIEGFTAHATAQEMNIDVAGSANAGGIRIETATLERSGGPGLKLTRPTVIVLGHGTSDAAWKLENLNLEGEGMAVAANVTWGRAGAAEISAHAIRSDWLRELVPLPPSRWSIENLTVRGNWNDGPAKFTADAAVKIDLGDDRSATASVRAQGDEGGLQLASLRVAEGSGVIVNATGHLPITVRPGAGEVFAVDEKGKFALDAQTTDNPDFWKKLTELSGVELVHPEVTVRMSGTWAEPRGEARIAAERIALTGARFKGAWPKIEALDLRFTGDRDGLKIERGSVSIAGQAVRAEGMLPLRAANWSDFRKQPMEFVRRASLHVAVPDGDMAAVAQYFPKYLAASGRLQIDATLKPGLHLSGFLRVKDAVSRPLGPLGILQDIDADVRLDERTINFASVTAHMGGQLVTLRGTAELRERHAPRLNLTLAGENLPFVRKTGLLLRGDLDLALKTPESGPPNLSGNVRLRDSLFLSDVRSLIPTGAKEATSRPPYFSIDAP